jgi:uncharacterized protein
MEQPQLTIDLSRVAGELGFTPAQVQNVVALLDEGNTIPFITRYRKERTGNLDEEQLRSIQNRVVALRQLGERSQTILRLIETQGKLTPELRAEIEKADSLKRLEDLYLPYRPKKRSRASAARERGLEPLADRIWAASADLTDLESAAAAFVKPEQELPTTAEVLQGAADILAERIGDDAEVRARVRKISWQTGRLTVTATGKAAESGQAYRDYFEYGEAAAKIPPHRTLALNRGEKAGFLRVKFEWDDPKAQDAVVQQLRLDEHRFPQFLRSCAVDALGRLVQPSLEREVRRELTERAEAHAVAVFARNLRNLLLQPPLQGKRVLAIDPGFRTGCKLALLDEIGTCLLTDVIYLGNSDEKKAATKTKLAGLLTEHQARLIAIGNGTACRETEELIAELIAESMPDVQYIIVNEAGASIYSASLIAREEFPDFDATIRGTISIGRRLQDPLSELVKIDPQHIGVGMYQHDVSPKELKESLTQVVESCVNYVGVDLNTASPALLSHVSGLNQLTARRVVEWREKHGPFTSRSQLREIGGIGDATFTQAAGFLKITRGDEPLDYTWIHPESYPVARQVLERLSLTPESLQAGSTLAPALRDRMSALDPALVAGELQVGLPTLTDILEALARPGRDPRADLPGHIFRQGILKLEDLQPGMELQGTVLNVVDFGVFVDVGLKDSGLVHVSQMSTQFVRSPHDAAAVGDVVKAWVLGIDLERRRVSLTMIDPALPRESPPPRRPQPERKPPTEQRPQPARNPPERPKPKAPAAQGAPPATATREGTPAPASPAAKQADRRPKKPRKPEGPPPVLTSDMTEGRTPLRGFDELKQLWKDRKQ